LRCSTGQDYPINSFQVFALLITHTTYTFGNHPMCQIYPGDECETHDLITQQPHPVYNNFVTKLVSDI